MGKKKQAKGQAKKRHNEQKEVIPFNERLSALTVCYWNTSIGYLGVERGANIRTAGQLGVAYWKPTILTKGWDSKACITVWLEGDVPAVLRERASGASAPTHVTDEMVLEESLEPTRRKLEAAQDQVPDDLLPFRVWAVDGMNRSLALQDIWRESQQRSPEVTLRVLHLEASQHYRVAIATTLNDVSKVFPSVRVTVY